ncbi:DUF6415 family natural product biosynthesis protein [Streptomyces griseoincarnatus]
MSVPTVARWAPPTVEMLTALLHAVRDWEPFDGDAVLDDIAAVLDDYTPTEYEVDEQAPRLRGHLVRLSNLAIASRIDERDERVAVLVAQGREIRSAATPSDHRRAVGYVRQMAWTLNELHELLVANQCLTEEP